MTNYVYAPGVDSADPLQPVPNRGSYDPSQGSGGVFARLLQGATPKYARNQGEREVMQKGTLARMYIRVTASERRLFDASVADENLRRNILPRLVGTAQAEVTDTGYIDFFLQSINSGLTEKYQVVETLADNYVAYFFGQSAPIWQFSGVLLNTVQDDQFSAWIRLYTAVLRGTQLARRGKVVSLRYDNFVVTGTILNTTWQQNAQNEMSVPFGFQLLVKRLMIVNYTAGWRPTDPNGGGLITDPRLVVADGTGPTQGQQDVVQGSATGGAPSDRAPTPTDQATSAVTGVVTGQDSVPTAPFTIRPQDAGVLGPLSLSGTTDPDERNMLMLQRMANGSLVPGPLRVLSR